MLKSVIEAFKNLFKPVHTADYPAKPLPLPEAYRGLIEYDVDECTFCDKCEKVCPPGAIHFYQHEDGHKSYRYNEWVCIFCGECVRACPKPDAALWQSEKKPRIGLKTHEVNEEWIAYEAACEKSRDDFAAAKKAARAAKQQQKEDEHE
ncbi:MAG: 4Fe-4S dicluster domain-containing protein [Sulfurimonadaceae bacterium]|nr:4Fe-4S dicluster domain-containing protein [Sulfurimonadaceae bacterium]